VDEPVSPRPGSISFIRLVVIGPVSAILGGLLGVGVGGAVRGMTEHLGLVGPVVATLFAWTTAAMVSLTTAAVSLRAEVLVAARRLWWVYLGTTLVSALAIRANLVTGASGRVTLAGWGWVYVPLFSGAWTSLVLSGGLVAWVGLQREKGPAA
jgi:hypothetical protein